ncbi:hypothetical protein SORBI_3006G253600 [Sorghum bicolor]|uniref:Uncharacterized protein n=1 Tax=Sorghum bicolor TaxID=4558 RepID=A0A1B6PNW4_SORBI|nr:hypothetical protein SORBI_3006G253600 [Sorghum bicolor]
MGSLGGRRVPSSASARHRARRCRRALHRTSSQHHAPRRMRAQPSGTSSAPICFAPQFQAPPTNAWPVRKRSRVGKLVFSASQE